MDSAIILGILVVLVALYFHRRSRRDKDDGVDNSPPNPVTNVKLEIKER
jgi:hypothetical protein